MTLINYHHLYYFWIIRREGSLTAASEKLRLAPSTVISKLVTCRVLEPFFELPGQTQLIWREGKEEKLLAELALHQLDVVLTDTPLPPRHEHQGL